MALHDTDVLMFNQFSADKKPGMGVMEHLNDRSMYQELSKIQNWRKMLSNEYIENLTIDGFTWLSVEHFVLAHNYIDSESMYDTLKSITDPKELSKLKKRTIDEDALETALWAKFSTEEFKAILYATHSSTLTNWKRGMTVNAVDDKDRFVEPNLTCTILMKIRSAIQSAVKDKEVHTEQEDASSSPPVEKVLTEETEIVVQNAQTNQFESMKILSKKDFDDFDGFISKYDHQANKSVNVLTKYEKTNIIGVRMEQLSMGSETYISSDLALSLGCVKKIAQEEFDQKRIPYIICRSMPNNVKEYWKLADLIYV